MIQRAIEIARRPLRGVCSTDVAFRMPSQFASERPALPCVSQLWAAAGIKDPSYVFGNTAGVSCTHTRTGRPGAGGSGT